MKRNKVEKEKSVDEKLKAIEITSTE